MIVLFGGAMICLAAYWRQINLQEFSYGISCLAIPYVTRGYDMAMASHGRFVLAAFPMVIAIAILIRSSGNRAAFTVAKVALVVGTWYMAVYAALYAAWFAAWYGII